MKDLSQIPIFPLGVVLLPEMLMPLHIFEERYKEMINECLKHNKPFGVVYYDGKKIHKVGCEAHILEVLRRYEDGRMDIVVHGVRRFYMDTTVERRAYLESSVFYIDDVEESFREGDQALLSKSIDLLKHLARLSGDPAEKDRFDGIDLKRLSFLIPGAEGFSMEERQRFLEMTSVRERLQKGAVLLGKVIARVKINREAGEIVGGNGHLRAFLAGKGLNL